MPGWLRWVWEAGKWVAKKVFTKKPKPKTTKPNGGKKVCTSGCKKLPRRAKPPNRRHSLCRTKGNSDRSKKNNTMLDPSVDVADDIAKLKPGQFTQDGRKLIVNGRTYLQEASGTVFPIAGPGTHNLSSAEHKFLKAANEFGLDAAKKSFERNPNVTKAVIDRVSELRKLCK